jgi:hypothetical protein
VIRDIVNELPTGHPLQCAKEGCQDYLNTSNTNAQCGCGALHTMLSGTPGKATVSCNEYNAVLIERRDRTWVPLFEALKTFA